MLPCRRIFAVRELESETLFDKRLCHDRWSRDHYLCHGSRDATQSSDMLSLSKKLEKVSKVIKDLTSLVAEADGDEFDRRMDRHIDGFEENVAGRHNWHHYNVAGAFRLIASRQHDYGRHYSR